MHVVAETCPHQPQMLPPFLNSPQPHEPSGPEWCTTPCKRLNTPEETDESKPLDRLPVPLEHASGSGATIQTSFLPFDRDLRCNTRLSRRTHAPSHSTEDSTVVKGASVRHAAPWPCSILNRSVQNICERTIWQSQSDSERLPHK
jgi:hypothetical protein